MEVFICFELNSAFVCYTCFWIRHSLFIRFTMILRHGWAWPQWGAHLCKHSVEPLQWTVEVQFDPARCWCYSLPSVFSAPSFDEAHPYSTHTRQLVDSFKSLRDGLRKESCKLLVIEDLQVTPGWYLADSGGMPAITLVAIGALHKYRWVAQALREHFATNVIQSDSFADVATCLLHYLVPIHVWQ